MHLDDAANVPNNKLTICSNIKEFVQQILCKWNSLVAMHAIQICIWSWLLWSWWFESLFTTQHFACHITWLCNKSCEWLCKIEKSKM